MFRGKKSMVVGSLCPYDFYSINYDRESFLREEGSWMQNCLCWVSGISAAWAARAHDIKWVQAGGWWVGREKRKSKSKKTGSTWRHFTEQREEPSAMQTQPLTSSHQPSKAWPVSDQQPPWQDRPQLHPLLPVLLLSTGLGATWGPLGIPGCVPCQPLAHPSLLWGGQSKAWRRPWQGASGAQQ